MRAFLRLTVLLCSSLILAACAGNKTYGLASDATVVGAQELPTPSRADLVDASRPYIVGPFDKLRIDVFGIEELSDIKVQTDAGGLVSFPLVGTLQAAGRTPEELAELIEERLRGRFVRDPQVTVNLEETVSQVITVDGQVETPGLYPVIGRMTLMRAVATAGGASEYAKLQDVVIFRTVNGQRMVGLYNLEGIRRGNYGDPEVFANDIVFVGDSPARRRFDKILQIVPLITSPLVLLLRG